MISVERLMSTSVLSVKDSTTLRDAAARMFAAGIRHLPVEDDRHHVVGIISDRDLQAARRKRGAKRVGDVMTREVHTVQPQQPAARAAVLMLENKLGSLPVVDDEATLVGIITETDFLRFAMETLSGRDRRGSEGAVRSDTP